jgi:RimJ/RimL family protein N-acetyltransferase
MDLRATRLLSQRLSLKAFGPEDAAEIFSAVTPRITRFMAFEPAPSLDIFQQISRDWITMMAAGTDIHLVVRSKETSEFLGMSGLHKIDSAEPETGIWIKEAQHGHGYGREAVTAVIDWGARDLALPSFIYPTAEANHSSRRLAESLGGIKVGTRTLPKPGDIVLPMILYRISPGAALV